MQIFESIPVLNGLNKGIGLIQKWKTTLFRKFVLISKWNRKKEQSQIFYLLIINSFSPESQWKQQQGF